ncbi:MAG: sigma-70 family RNA polymerase sigma factor [Phycisphaerales bacterium]
MTTERPSGTTEPGASLAELARQAAAGSESAFATLQLRLTPGLRRLFLERCANKHDLADDLTQRALLGLWDALRKGRYDPAKSAVTTFAYAVASKVWLQHLRAAGRADAAVERYTRLVAGQPKDDLTPEDEQAFSALVQALRDVIAERPEGGAADVLNTEERWLVRSWAMGESDRALARKMGIAPSNVNFRKQGVYAKLRAYLSRLGYGTQE